MSRRVEHSHTSVTFSAGKFQVASRLKHLESTLRLYSGGQWLLRTEFEKTTSTDSWPIEIKLYVRFVDRATGHPLGPGPSGVRWGRGKSDWRKLFDDPSMATKRRRVVKRPKPDAKGKRSLYIVDNFKFLADKRAIRAEIRMKYRVHGLGYEESDAIAMTTS